MKKTIKHFFFAAIDGNFVNFQLDYNSHFTWILATETRDFHRFLSCATFRQMPEASRPTQVTLKQGGGPVLKAGYRINKTNENITFD